MTQRLEKLDPATLTPEQLEIYRRYTSGKRAAAGTDFSLVDADGRLEGPTNAWLLQPALGAALEHLGGVLRYGLRLSPRSKEIAILLVAHHRHSEFEVYAHIKAGRAAGLTDADLAALADGQPIDFRTDEERAVHAATLQLLHRQELDDETFWSTVEVIGREKLFELLTVVGFYQMVATQLSVFDVRPPQS